MLKVFPLSQLSGALNKSPDVLRCSDQLEGEAYQSVREEDGEYFSAYYTFCDGVLEVSCDRDWNIRAIFVDPGRSKGFEVQIPECPMSISRTLAREKFGNPEQSSEASTHEILGYIPPSDRFKLVGAGCLMHLGYSQDYSCVEKLTLMPLDWQPGET
ncbi:hypothetical protein [Qipengyuania sp. DGS5-3]|uniref:hypothetical protein n=1 Tax=Qipengyuania sp. DGS5-3 TaxID=3349632 RepID=UPI0036D29EF8